jgi:hypothetical protein
MCAHARVRRCLGMRLIRQLLLAAVCTAAATASDAEPEPWFRPGLGAALRAAPVLAWATTEVSARDGRCLVVASQFVPVVDPLGWVESASASLHVLTLGPATRMLGAPEPIRFVLPYADDRPRTALWSLEALTADRLLLASDPAAQPILMVAGSIPTLTAAIQAYRARDPGAAVLRVQTLEEAWAWDEAWGRGERTFPPAVWSDLLQAPWGRRLQMLAIDRAAAAGWTPDQRRAVAEAWERAIDGSQPDIAGMMLLRIQGWAVAGELPLDLTRRIHRRFAGTPTWPLASPPTRPADDGGPAMPPVNLSALYAEVRGRALPTLEAVIHAQRQAR